MQALCRAMRIPERGFFLCALVVVALAGCVRTQPSPRPAAAAPNPNESLARWRLAEVKMEVIAEGKPYQIMETKNGNLRMQMCDDKRGERIDIVREAERKYITLDAVRKEATVSEITTATMKQVESERKDHEKIKWKRSDDGKSWATISEDGLHRQEIWLDGPGGLPSKRVTMDTDLPYTVEFRYLKVGGIPDSDFEIPPAYKVIKADAQNPAGD